MAAFSVVTDCTTHRTYNISYLALCRKKFANLWRRAFPLAKHVENHSRLILTIKVSGRRGRNQWMSKVDHGVMARRGMSRLGSMSSPAKEWRGHKPPRASCSLTPFPHHLTTPSPKSTSCQERDLLKPASWRLQLQKRWYFYPDPVSCLPAEGFDLLVFGFVAFDTDYLPCRIRTEMPESW